MQRETRLRLQHILDACHAAQRFSDGCSLRDYLGDEMLRSAVERQLLIVGEALSIIRRAERAVLESIPDHRAIIDFRNVLAHDYAVVEDELVWSILTESVPTLVEVVTHLLEQDAKDS